MGLKIGDQISVIAFDDHDLFEIHSPSITAISQPIEEIADVTINLLLGKLKQNIKLKKEQNLVLSSQLIVRESCKTRP